MDTTTAPPLDPQYQKQLPGLHSKCQKAITKSLNGKDWTPIAAVEKKICLENADSRYRLAEIISQLTANGKCEVRDGPEGREIRLKNPTASGKTTPVPHPKDSALCPLAVATPPPLYKPWRIPGTEDRDRSR
jgi:hypothetical protein